MACKPISATPFNGEEQFGNLKVGSHIKHPAQHMNRRVVVIAFAIAVVAIVGATIFPLLLNALVGQFTHLNTPVRFTRIDSSQVQAGRSTRQFPAVQYTYVVSGKQYTSTRIFCTANGDATVNWPRVNYFLEDAKNGAEVLAWFPPSSPESACISLHPHFGYSVASNTSSQCRAK